MLTVDSPVRVDQAPKVPPRRAPELGEHTVAVLDELGFDDAAIEQLRAAGAIPTPTAAGTAADDSW
jgi:formyl-CoA transferase